MQPVYDAGIGVYPCRGNHDAIGVKPSVDPTGALSKEGWNNVFTGPYALPGNGDGGICITILAIHGKMLGIRASELAGYIIKHHFSS